MQLNQGRFQKTILAYAKALDTTTASKCYNSLPYRVHLHQKLMDWQEHNISRGRH